MNFIETQIIGAKRFDAEGRKTGQLIVMEATDKQDPDSVGQVTMKIACPYDMVNVLRDKKLPDTYQIVCELKLQSGKAGLYAKEIRSVNSPIK